jgi:CheY-like chemotaxis protein
MKKITEGSMKNILVIEDEKDVRVTVVELLENAGYKTVYAGNGEEAIKLLEMEIPDLVISDMMMPKMDGYQVLDYLHKFSNITRIPFIFLSAKADNSDIRVGMNGGADDYITKPFRAKELLKAVETQLKKYEKVESKIEEICLNISAYVPHELKTPLVSIMGYTDLLKEELNHLQKKDINEMLENIKLSSGRLLNTIEKFIRYTEIQLRISGKLQLNRQKLSEFSPRSVIESICAKLAGDARRSEDVKLDLVEAEICIPEYDYEFMVKEILQNALKFSNPGSMIIVKSYLENENYYFNVTDYGRGFTSVQIADINPFIQYDKKILQQRGNGLGLVSIRKLTDFYKGRFNITSEIDTYTTVCVGIPLYQRK